MPIKIFSRRVEEKDFGYIRDAYLTKMRIVLINERRSLFYHAFKLMEASVLLDYLNDGGDANRSTFS